MPKIIFCKQLFCKKKKCAIAARDQVPEKADLLQRRLSSKTLNVLFSEKNHVNWLKDRHLILIPWTSLNCPWTKSHCSQATAASCQAEAVERDETAAKMRQEQPMSCRVTILRLVALLSLLDVVHVSGTIVGPARKYDTRWVRKKTGFELYIQNKKSHIHCS